MAVAEMLGDYDLNPSRRRVAQVDIPHPCLDKGNNHRKEQVVESLINHFLYTVTRLELDLGRSIQQFSPDDYKVLNARLAAHQTEYYIPVEESPNLAVAVRQDAAMPPLARLQEWNMIDMEAIKKYSQSNFGRRFPAVTAGKD